MQPKTKLEFSAGGIILNDKKQILMIRDPWGKWTFPKGHIDKNEKPHETAIREVKEEVGLVGRIIKQISKDDYWFVANWEKDKPRVHKMVYWFLMQAEGNPKLQTEEITDAKWVNRDEIKNLVTYKNTKNLLTLALNETLGNIKN